MIDGVNGYSTEVDDVDALVAAVVQLDRERERHREMAKHQRETVAQWPWSTALTSALGPSMSRCPNEPPDGARTRMDGPAPLKASERVRPPTR